jgi:uncharacterized protein
VIDVYTTVGAYPWRQVPGTSPEAVLQGMDRTGVKDAWVSHLPSLFWKDPGPGNLELYHLAEGQARFHPVPAIHPGLPLWERELSQAADRKAPAVRCDPGLLGLAPLGGEITRLLAAAGEAGMLVTATVKLEDGRGRHPLDVAPELTPATVRGWVRAHTTTRFLVTAADREFIEQVHFGLTPEEAGRIWWDISWVWGPPEDHLALLLATVGVDRFLYGSGQPLRLPETPLARLDLLDLSAADRVAIVTGNAARLAARKWT